MTEAPRRATVNTEPANKRPAIKTSARRATCDGAPLVHVVRKRFNTTMRPIGFRFRTAAAAAVDFDDFASLFIQISDGCATCVFAYFDRIARKVTLGKHKYLTSGHLKPAAPGAAAATTATTHGEDTPRIQEDCLTNF